ncbi:polysaccharide pyruvyl transferase family protein [Phocaeicola plebeius]|jgi:hypothetical protein|uniref:polysaccharide pyruvyl transferase family protein n=1 Tax=Phocaeicola plebeius TaxID=310297 RepID=UPI00241F0CEB|nr:polysaccharide pyruvyl transferase family protein [Phocaeicola plebeius]
MKIGILTLPLHTNYGGILQTYALQTVLERMNHKTIVLDKSKQQKLPLPKRPFCYCKRIIKKYILNQKCRIFEEDYQNKIYPIISQYTQPFINQHIHYVALNNFSSLDQNEFDAIIVGSDQIWRPIYYRNIENAYLAFAKKWKIKRIAYAASFGTDNWEYTSSQTDKCKWLVQKFDAISVRESSAVKLCQQYFNIKAQHVLDPTMLLDKDDYIQLFEGTSTPQSPGNMLVYILDETPEKTELINQIAKEKQLIPFRVNSQTENPNAPLEKRIQPSVEQWLRGFYDAKFIITDSFHACVFAILFHKPFVVYGNAKRGTSRFVSLLKLFSIEDKLITKPTLTNFNYQFDWNGIQKKLDKLKIESLNFLKQNL